MLGNLECVDAVCRALANEAGARVVSIDYRLAPEHPFPAPLEDALNATGPSRPIVGRGRQRRRQPRRARRASTRASTPVADLSGDRRRPQLPVLPEFDGRYGLTAAAMRRFWDLYLDGPTARPDASPLRARTERCPPT